jgi:GT2 family glycosyltransferase
MFLSVIIPMGRPETAQPTFDAVLGQLDGADDVEVIPVGTHAAELVGADDERVRPVVLPERLNPARTRMAGIAAARGAWLLMIDDDIEIAPGFLAHLRELIAERPRLGAVGARLPGLSARYWSHVVDLANFWSQQSDEAAPRPELYSAAMAVRAATYHEAGGFNPAFAIGEDIDLTRRIAVAGHEIWYDPRLVARHNHRRTELRSALRYFWTNGDLSKFIYEHCLALRGFSVTEVLLQTRDAWRRTQRLNAHHYPRFTTYAPGIILVNLVFHTSMEIHRIKHLAAKLDRPGVRRPHPRSISENLLARALACVRGRRFVAANAWGALAWIFAGLGGAVRLLTGRGVRT